METSKVRMLPIFNIEGTDFYVDTRLNEFREKDAPWNRISMDEITESTEGDITGLIYNTHTKNVYEGIIDPEQIPAHVKLIIVPPLTVLDPVGIARKYGLADDAFTKGQTENQASQKPKRHKRGRHL